MEHKRSCFNCLNAVIDAGYAGSYEEPGVGASLEECKGSINEEQVDKYTEDELPNYCGCYLPRLVDKCSECGTVIGEPEWAWDLWVSFYVTTPVCSESCRKKGQDKVDAEIAELRGG